MSETVVEMLVVSGQGSDSQWFEYRPTFFGDIVRVEWNIDTMQAELPSNIAEYLLKNGYARPGGSPRKPPPSAVVPPTEPTKEPAVEDGIEPSSHKHKEKRK